MPERDQSGNEDYRERGERTALPASLYRPNYRHKALTSWVMITRRCSTWRLLTQSGIPSSREL